MRLHPSMPWKSMFSLSLEVSSSNVKPKIAFYSGKLFKAIGPFKQCTKLAS